MNSLTYTPAAVTDVDITSDFWIRVQECMRSKSLPAIIKNLRETGRAYALTWTKETAPVKPHPFWDSDVYKTLEACCYYLMKGDDSHLRTFVDESVKIIREAQHDDGYINSYYTITGIEGRFTNLRDMHELYCLGHLCEAAVAHRILTGTDALIGPTMRYIRYVASQFGPEEGKRKGYPGHEEIETGLMRLYNLTGNKLCLDLAEFFILERGKTYDGEYYYDIEARARGADPYDARSAEFRPQYTKPRDYAYHQAHLPLLEQTTIEGHCVRAMYYLTAAADYAKSTKDMNVLQAVKRLYDNATRRKMYVTGGLGSVERSEGFTSEYWLPDQEEGGCAYSETCASFALVLLSQRLLQMDLIGEYGDVLEIALYNAVLGAVAIDGTSFYYENPLTTFEGHGKERSTWFDVACCPPNVAKIFGLLPQLIYSQSSGGSSFAVHLFISSTFRASVQGHPVVIRQDTGMPWDGHVKITVESEVPIMLQIRSPNWATDGGTLLGASGELMNGYIRIPLRRYSKDDSIDLHFPCIPRKVFAHPRTGKNEVAIGRGPLIYCAENIDNEGLDFMALGLETHSNLEDLPPQEIAGVDGVVAIRAAGRVKDLSFWKETEQLYDGNESRMDWTKESVEVTFVPYFLRQNRGGNGAMQVWTKRT